MTSPYLMRPVRTLEQAQRDRLETQYKIAAMLNFAVPPQTRDSLAYAPEIAGCPKIWQESSS